MDTKGNEYVRGSFKVVNLMKLTQLPDPTTQDRLPNVGKSKGKEVEANRQEIKHFINIFFVKCSIFFTSNITHVI